jgi:AraC-like DNA-binding protein
MVMYAVSQRVNRPRPTANHRLLWPLLEALRAVGVDVPALLASIGLDEDAAYGGESRIELDQLFALWRSAVVQSKDPALGVRVAAFIDPASSVSWPMPLSLIEHLGLLSATLGEAIALQGRFLRLLRDGLRTSLEIEGERAFMRMELPEEEPPVLVEYDFAIAINVLRRVSRLDLCPLEVWFTHEAPANTQPQGLLFRAPLRYGAPFNALVMKTTDVSTPLRRINEGFRMRIVRGAERLLAQLPSLELFEDKVCAQIEAELPRGNTNASAVAERLGVSQRTLHRKLQHEGASYQALLDRVRLRLAVRHLGAGRSISDVATLVGFAQASTFHRAFKSWTGETPAEYQMQRRRGGGSSAVLASRGL